MANKISRRELPSYPARHNKREKKLYETLISDKNISDTFDSGLVVSNFDNADGTIYTGATAEVLAVHSGEAAYEVYQAAVATPAVVAPYQSADGLELKPVAAADALELTNGRTSRSKAAWTVGDGSFYFKTTLKIDTVSSVTEIFAGLRKAEAYQADPDSYDEMAAFNIGKDVDGQVEIHTILNNAATAESAAVGSAMANGDSVTLEIQVAKDGRCRFFRDGTESTAAAFKFDAAEVVVPFLHLNTETGDPGVSISLWEIGALEDSN
jgi:hypothetical protein